MDLLLGAGLLYLIIGIVKTGTTEIIHRNGTPAKFYDYFICVVLWPLIKEDL